MSLRGSFIKYSVLLHTFNDSFQVLAQAVYVTNGSKVITNLVSPIQIFEPLKNGPTKSNLVTLRDLCPDVLPDLESRNLQFQYRLSLFLQNSWQPLRVQTK